MFEKTIVTKKNKYYYSIFQKTVLLFQKLQQHCKNGLDKVPTGENVLFYLNKLYGTL